MPSSTHSARNNTDGFQGEDAATAARIARYELQETAERALGEGARVGVCLKLYVVTADDIVGEVVETLVRRHARWV